MADQSTENSDCGKPMFVRVKTIADVDKARGYMRRENRPMMLDVDEVETDEQAMEVARILVTYHPDDLQPSEWRPEQS